MSGSECECLARNAGKMNVTVAPSKIYETRSTRKQRPFPFVTTETTRQTGADQHSLKTWGVSPSCKVPGKSEVAIRSGLPLASSRLG